MKRSGREARWAELPPARTRIALEAAFLILGVAGAAVVRLTPLSIIALMLVAWLLVAVLERASFRRLFSRRGSAVEPLAAPAAGLEEHPSSAHVPLAEPRLPMVEAEIVITEIVVEAIPPPNPAVTKLPLDLPGVDAAPRPAEVPQEPQPVERAAPPISAPVLARPPAREWNIWDLERRAREQAGDALRDEEWAGLFMHLRQFANADGVPPMQFDDLVRESFPELIQAA